MEKAHTDSEESVREREEKGAPEQRVESEHLVPDPKGYSG